MFIVRSMVKMIKKILVFFIFVMIPCVNLALAHSPVGYVIPKDGSIIKQAPEEMEIVFTAPAKLIKLDFSRIISSRGVSMIGDLLGSENLESIKLGASHLMVEAKRHLISLPELEKGLYKTKWRALSEDGHAIKGEFEFEISSKGMDISGMGFELLSGEGSVKRVRGSKITIKHGSLSDLMPAMTMEYQALNPSKIPKLKRGDTIIFQINKDLEIVSIQPK